MKLKYSLLFLLLSAMLCGACSEEDLNPTSIFDDEVEMEKNELDIWLDNNYLSQRHHYFGLRGRRLEGDTGRRKLA